MNTLRITTRLALAWLTPVAAAWVISGCSQNSQSVSANPHPELEQLRIQNQEVQKLRRENQELSRLLKDRDEVARLRKDLGELPRLRQENQALRLQIAEAASQRRNAATAANAANSAAGAVSSANPSDPNNPEAAEADIDPANIPQEGDEILIEPKLLSKVLPGFDWEKLERKEPIAVRALLEQQGIILTNYQQLIDYGITNYTIRRNPPAEQAQPNP